MVVGVVVRPKPYATLTRLKCYARIVRPVMQNPRYR